MLTIERKLVDAFHEKSAQLHMSIDNKFDEMSSASSRLFGILDKLDEKVSVQVQAECKKVKDELLVETNKISAKVDNLESTIEQSRLTHDEQIKRLTNKVNHVQGWLAQEFGKGLLGKSGQVWSTFTQAV